MMPSDSTESKNALLSKTVWVNVLTVLISFLTTIVGADFIPEPYLVYITGLIIPVVNVVLRFLTGEPISLVAPVRRH